MNLSHEDIKYVDWDVHSILGTVLYFVMLKSGFGSTYGRPGDPPMPSAVEDFLRINLVRKIK